MINTNFYLPMLTILGPTACGKTSLAVALAERIDAEIISADSRQVYRGMDIGTGKDLQDYRNNFLKAYNNIIGRGKQVILCGGSGLYLESVLRSYRLFDVPANQPLRDSLEGKSLEKLTAILSSFKTLHNTTDVDTPQRAIRAIEIETFYQTIPAEQRSFPTLPNMTFGISIPRELRRRRITERLHKRLQQGMLDEVQRLLDSGISPDDLIYYGLEYKFLTLHLIGSLSYDQMVHDLEIAIHQFAKRQMTWFRGMERRGITIHWIDGTLSQEDIVRQILDIRA